MNLNIDFYTDYEDLEKLNEYNEFLEKYSGKIKKIVGEALVLNEITLSNIYVGIGVVTMDTIHTMNKEHRNVDRETDVLSFPMFERGELNNLKNIPENEEISIGDIVLCMDVIEKQAVEYGTGFNREMLYMITHGICHLLGYDHIEEDEKIDMRKIEEKILLGVGEE